MLLDGARAGDRVKKRGADATLLIVFNAHHEAVEFTLPPLLRSRELETTVRHDGSKIGRKPIRDWRCLTRRIVSRPSNELHYTTVKLDGLGFGSFSAAGVRRSSTRFGFSWPVAVSLRKLSIMGLDFLGFPWILSSELRLINELRRIFRKNIFLPPSYRRRTPGTAEFGLGMTMGRIVHGGKLSRISDFLQAMSAQPFCFGPAPPSQSNRF
jgi:hypothetical protein